MTHEKVGNGVFDFVSIHVGGMDNFFLNSLQQMTVCLSSALLPTNVLMIKFVGRNHFFVNGKVQKKKKEELVFHWFISFQTLLLEIAIALT